ncbi:MAG: hypothetical protein ABI632_00920 [Pseudolysinimonas sp.]
MSEAWIEHRRGPDGELLGWMKPSGDGFVAIDLLGRDVTGVVEWIEAEHLLDELGIAYLAEPYELLLDSGTWLRVRVTELSAREIRVKKEDWGDMNVPQVYFTIAFPVTGRLRPLSS